MTQRVWLCDPVNHNGYMIRAILLRRPTPEDGAAIFAAEEMISTTAEGNWRFLAICAVILGDLPLEVAGKLSALDIQRIGDLIADRGPELKDKNNEHVDIQPYC